MSSSTNRQRGDALLEALVGVVLVTIIGMGSAYTASRNAVSHKFARTQAMAVSQLRQMLQSPSDIAAWCSGTAPPAVRIRPADTAIAPTDLSVTVTCSAAGTLTIGGRTIATPPQRVTLTVSSAAMFGGNGTIAVGNVGGS